MFVDDEKEVQSVGPIIYTTDYRLWIIVHGWAKLSGGKVGFEKLLGQIGVPFPHCTSWIVLLTELAGGSAV